MNDIRVTRSRKGLREIVGKSDKGLKWLRDNIQGEGPFIILDEHLDDMLIKFREGDLTVEVL